MSNSNDDNNGGDYDVGYQKPPKHSQFKPGQSGNYQGRPKGKKNASTFLKEALAETVTINENGTKRTISKLEATFKQLVNMAAKGDLRAIQRLLLLVMDMEAKDMEQGTSKRGIIPKEQQAQILANIIERANDNKKEPSDAND
ncbi:MAG: DUF5681 domain-containing protein [Rickettsiales bacterium]|nr:DUF5681 domain-containing protein [Rickettsiales bacterium]